MIWWAFLRGLFRRRALLNAARLSGSGLIYHVVYLFRGIVAARLLGPELMGAWSAGYILNMYLACSHLGSVSAVRREMTIAWGAGDTRRIDRLASAGLTLVLVPGLVVALGVGIWVAFRWEDLPTDYRWIIPVVVGLAILQQLGVYYSFCQFSQERFTAASVSQIVSAGLLAATIPLIWWAGLPGLALGLTLSHLAGLAVIWQAAPVPFRLSGDRQMLGYVLLEGLPFLGIMVVYTLQVSADRVIILSWYGERSLGLYSLALQAGAVLTVFLNSAGQVAYSRMGAIFGASSDPAKLYAVVNDWSLRLAWAATPILVLVALFCPPLVELLLPAYNEANAAVRLMCLLAFFQTLTIVPGTFLQTIRRSKLSLLLQGLGAVLTWLLCGAAAWWGGGLAGIAAASSLAMAAYAVLLGVAAARSGGAPMVRWFQMLLAQLVPLACGTTIIAAILWAVAQPSGESVSLAVVALLAALPAGVWAARRFGLLSWFNECRISRRSVQETGSKSELSLPAGQAE